jgi:chemotaxis signal transduction protein
MGEILFALPAELVEDVIPLQSILPLLNAPTHFLGTVKRDGDEVMRLDLSTTRTAHPDHAHGAGASPLAPPSYKNSV